jgi:undecaprenyl phosphate-alpha-L-ara4N flippase subunit ArnE
VADSRPEIRPSQTTIDRNKGDDRLQSVSILTLVLASFCASVGTLLLKAGATGRTDFIQFLNPYVVVGLGLYALGSLLWIFCMSSQSLSVVYPFTALTFVLVLLGAIVFQGERPSSINILGIVVVLVGIGLIVWGRKSS